MNKLINLIDGDVLIYRAIWKTETLEDSIVKLEEDISSIIENTFADDYQIAIGDSSNNFRLELYPDYKKSASRQKAKEGRSPLYDPLKQYLSSRENVTLCSGSKPMICYVSGTLKSLLAEIKLS